MDKLEHKRYSLQIDGQEVAWFTAKQLGGEEGAEDTFRVVVCTHKRAKKIELIDTKTGFATMSYEKVNV